MFQIKVNDDEANNLMPVYVKEQLITISKDEYKKFLLALGDETIITAHTFNSIELSSRGNYVLVVVCSSGIIIEHFMHCNPGPSDGDGCSFVRVTRGSYGLKKEVIPYLEIYMSTIETCADSLQSFPSYYESDTRLLWTDAHLKLLKKVLGGVDDA